MRSGWSVDALGESLRRLLQHSSQPQFDNPRSTELQAFGQGVGFAQKSAFDAERDDLCAASAGWAAAFPLGRRPTSPCGGVEGAELIDDELAVKLGRCLRKLIGIKHGDGFSLPRSHGFPPFR